MKQLLRVKGKVLNLVPIAQKLGAPEDVISEVTTLWKNDEEQLKVILQCWSTEQDNGDDPTLLRTTLQRLNPEGLSRSLSLPVN